MKTLNFSIILCFTLFLSTICYSQEIIVRERGVATGVIPAPRHDLADSIANGIQRGIMQESEHKHQMKMLERQHELEMELLKKRMEVLEKECELLEKGLKYREETGPNP